MIDLTTCHTIAFNPVSYAVGPLDPGLLTTYERCTDNGYPYVASVPTAFPASLVNHPEFWSGVEWGYALFDEQVPTSPMALLNWMYLTVQENLLSDESAVDLYVYVAAFHVGWLAGLAKYDMLLAHVGLAHLCFLLTFIPSNKPARWCFSINEDAAFEQKLVLTAYRARLRALAAEGVALREAYQQAYVPQTGGQA